MFSALKKKIVFRTISISTITAALKHTSYVISEVEVLDVTDFISITPEI